MVARYTQVAKALLVGSFLAGLVMNPSLTRAADELVIDENGDVGIGTGTPMFPLDVVRSLGAAGTLLNLENDGPTRIDLANTGAGDTWRINASNNGLRFNANGAFTFRIETNGNLFLNGSLTTGSNTNYPDYVFEPEYTLMPLNHLEEYISENKHLPNIPSAAEVKKRGGVNMSELQLKLLEKVEELTLYTLEQEKTIKGLQDQVASTDALKETVAVQAAALETLTERLATLEQAAAQQ